MSERIILKERNAAVVEAFFKILRAKGASTADAFEALRDAPAPRFYVSRSVAWRVLSAMRKGKHLPVKEANRQAMYKELMRRWRVRNYSQGAEFDAMLAEEAPSFFLTIWRLKNIVYKNLRNGKEK